MTTKADFSAEQWQALMQAPMAVGTLVTLSSPAIGDALKESVAVAQAIAKAAQSSGNSELMNAMASEFTNRASAKEAQIKPEGRDPEAIKSQMLGIVRNAAEVIDSKASPEEAAELKQWLYGLGEAAANAAKEGDFLGIGGQKVNADEEAALAEIKQALGM
ncbi:MAG: hypothetical protein KDD92_05010 [Caldilineaceae bacterium]|nr:hypothetical protein [Caldilineaceae bacterium]